MRVKGCNRVPVPPARMTPFMLPGILGPGHVPLMLQGVGGDPGKPAPATAQTRFSADGFWWWDGAEWRPALLEERLWGWNGQAWGPARLEGQRASRAGAGIAIGITAVFLGVIVLVSVVVVVVLSTMGSQILNVFAKV